MPIEILVKTAAQAKSFAQTWMENNRVFSREVLPCPGDFNFILEGTAVNGIPFIIAQPDHLATAIMAIVNVRVTDSSLASLNSMDETDRDEFLWNLQRELVFAPPNFAFDPDFEKTGIPKGIQFSKEIYYDELTEGRLAEAVNYATRSALWVIWSFRRKFGLPSEVETIE